MLYGSFYRFPILSYYKKFYYINFYNYLMVRYWIKCHISLLFLLAYSFYMREKKNEEDNEQKKKDNFCFCYNNGQISHGHCIWYLISTYVQLVENIKISFWYYERFILKFRHFIILILHISIKMLKYMKEGSLLQHMIVISK